MIGRSVNAGAAAPVLPASPLSSLVPGDSPLLAPLVVLATLVTSAPLPSLLATPVVGTGVSPLLAAVVLASPVVLTTPVSVATPVALTGVQAATRTSTTNPRAIIPRYALAGPRGSPSSHAETSHIGLLPPRIGATVPARMTEPLPPLAREFTGGQRLCDAPLIHTFDAVFSAAECEHIITLARPQIRRAQVSGVTGGSLSKGRSNTLTWIRHDVDATVQAVADRVAACVGLPLRHAESLQVVHYDTGEEYRPHFDAYDITSEKGQRYTARGGQRLVTALAYLSNVAEGGATGFPHLGIDVTPRRGKLLVFHNCLPGTTTRDPRSYHQGKAPVRGDKWAFNLWFHAEPYQEPR